MSNIHKFQCGYELFTTLCIVAGSDLAGIMPIQPQVEAKVSSTRSWVFSETESFSSVFKKISASTRSIFELYVRKSKL